MLPAVRLQLGVIIKALQQLGIRTDIADERLHEYLLLAVSFVGEAAYTQPAAGSGHTESSFRAGCRLIRAHCNLIHVLHSLSKGLVQLEYSKLLVLLFLL